jgi:exodeoxyribonuclease V alpha subunit
VSVAENDLFDVRRATGATGLLHDFNAAGVLDAADVHVARRLTALAGEDDEQVELAAALAVRGPRLGHVYVDLATIRETATVDAEEAVDLSALAWPAVAQWIERLRASDLVAVGEEGGRDRPLRLVGTSLYLDRYWREERQIAADLQALGAEAPSDVDEDVLADGLARLFPGDADERQRAASAAAVRHRFVVVAGGPGTGKTTTVARIVALLAEQAEAAGRPRPLIGGRRGAAGGGGARRRGRARRERRRPRAAARGERLDPAPPARLAARQPEPLPPPSRQPAAPRRRHR